MRDYEEFAARLRREIDEAGLDGEPRLPAGAGEAARPAAAPLLRLALAATLLIAAGLGGYAGWDAYDGRQAVTEHNRQFVDALFAHGLFEPERGAAAVLYEAYGLYESDWFDGE